MSSESSSPPLLDAAFLARSKEERVELVPSRRVGASEAGRARLEALLRSEFRTVWRFVRRFGVPEDSADDAAQEVFIVAARKLDEIEVGQERRFLFGVAVRVAANARRARAKRPDRAGNEAVLDAASQLPHPDALLDQKRRRELLDFVLDSMTLELRTAFVLFELEGFSAPEIAELLEIPLGTAASRLRRAREVFQSTVARLKAAQQGMP